jgi:DNA polymerase-1
VKLAATLSERGLRTRILLQVHDELLLEVPEDERAVVRPLVPEVMESVMTLDVPLRVDVKEGRDWAEV